MKKIFYVLFLIFSTVCFAQTPLKAPNGLLIYPKTTSEISAITSPSLGQMVFNSTIAMFQYWNGSAWASLSSDVNPDLQTVIDNGGLASSPDGNSFVDVNLSNTSPSIELRAETVAGQSNTFVNTDQFFAGHSNGDVISSFNADADGITIKEAKGVNETVIGIIEPTADQNYNFPNKPAGTYTLATTDDITGSGVQTVTGTTDEIEVDNTDPANPVISLPSTIHADLGGNAATATALQTSRTIGTITGDATATGSPFNGTANNTNSLTLATVNSNVGTFGSATQVPVFTVNGKGLVTGVTNTAITLPQSSITNLVTDLAAKENTLTITAVKTANYSIVANELAPYNLTGNYILTLPTTPADGTKVGTKIIALTGSNTLTINAGGSDVFNVAGGVNTLSLSVLNQVVVFQYKASVGIWYAVDTSISKTYIDAQDALKAPLASPALTGTPTAPTASANDNSAKIATTAYADAKVKNNLTATTTEAPSATAVNTALALKQDAATWVDISATSTIVGWASYTTKLIKYITVGKMTTVIANIVGVSNSGTTTFTLPTAIQSGVPTALVICYIRNNGTAATSRAYLATGSTVTVDATLTGGAWVNSGTKEIALTLTYENP